MKQRRLGNADPLVSEVGLGCWQFGGDFGDMAEATAQDIMHAATHSGINFFDTADVYGGGRSEKLIGQFLQQHTQPVFVATKFGRASDAYPNQYAEAVLRKSIDAALTRLQRDKIDLLQLHCVPTEVLKEGSIFDWLRKAQREGVITHFGASVETVDEGLLCMQQEGLLSLQVIFNIFRQKLIDELLPQAKQKGVGIIVRLPLASGLLAGKFTKETTFAKGDHRNYNRDGDYFNVGETFAGLPFEKGVELAEKVRPFVPEGMTMAQFALRWLLDHDAVSALIPGASSPEQANANAAVSEMKPLSSQTHEALTKLYHEEIKQHIRGRY